MEQAGMSRSVMRRAARMRINYLVSAITNPPKKAVETEPAKAEEKSQKQEPEAIAEQSHGKSQEDTPEAAGKTATDEKTAKDKAGMEKTAKTVQQEKKKTAKSDDETRANAKAEPDDEKSTDTEHEAKDSKGGSGKSATKARTPLHEAGQVSESNAPKVWIDLQRSNAPNV